ncbi:MAG: hypothetical protein FWD94_00425 [Treponema sp.]|nr:hypothetical protein [Treponema sp.]
MKRVRLVVPLLSSGLVLTAFLVAVFILLAKPPVLVVTDPAFAALYGESRIARRQFSASLALFRPVRPVTVLDDASPDIIVAAIRAASGNPALVIFPRRYSSVAERFHGEFPEVRALILRGADQGGYFPRSDGILSVYGTDRAADLRRAGLFSGKLGLSGPGGEKSAGSGPLPQRIHLVWNNRRMGGEERRLFSDAVLEADPEASVVFAASPSDMPDIRLLSTLSLLGGGFDFIDGNYRLPSILFAWLDPAFLPREVVVLFDDSPWAQVVPATKLALAGTETADIPSEVLFFSGENADNRTIRLLRRLSRGH